MKAAERALRFRILKEIGCIACLCSDLHRFPVDIHHLNLGQRAGQRRRGDEYTIPLCKWHHVGYPPDGLNYQEAAALLGPSMAKEPRLFRETFGDDDELLEATNLLYRAHRSRRVDCAPLDLATL